MKKRALVVVLFAASIGLSGFDFRRHGIPLEAIHSGGPPKDGIPAILEPRFLAAADAHFLEDTDLVIGIVQEGVAKAYPLRILAWHEVVNDRLGAQPIAVTY